MASEAIEKHHKSDGHNIDINNGQAAGQPHKTVDFTSRYFPNYSEKLRAPRSKLFATSGGQS